MSHSPSVGYVLKRYPRLSETFILNEMRALERLGTPLHIFSLLRPEEALMHPTVAEIQAPVSYFPSLWWELMLAVAKAHVAMAVGAPLRYLQALGLALWWALGSRSPLAVLKQFWRSAYVAQGCRKHNIQHLHAHFANAPSMVAHLASVMGNIPYSFSTHAKDLYLTPQPVLRQRVASASFVLTCTRYNLEYLRSFLPPTDWNKLHLVYHGIDLEAMSARMLKSMSPADPAELPLILSVGRLVSKKGMPDLVSACQILHQRGVQFRCLIVGEGPLRRELEDHIKNLGLSSRVSLAGAMAHDRLLALYPQATVFALAPHITENGDRDGIPNVIAEAMASGTVVATTAVSGIPELVEHDRTGLLVAPRDPVALADALQRLLGKKPLRERLAAAARRKIEERFECWETTKVVQALLGESGYS